MRSPIIAGNPCLPPYKRDKGRILVRNGKQLVPHIPVLPRPAWRAEVDRLVAAGYKDDYLQPTALERLMLRGRDNGRFNCGKY